MAAMSEKDQPIKDDELIFSPEDELSAISDLINPPKTQANAWKVMIVDDDPEVHNITRLVLTYFTYQNRPLQLISAYTGREAKTLIEQNPDTAVMLLDIVMETDNAGLDVVRHVRDVVNNYLVRIVLRTGQPGQAPEEEVISQYDINDYKDKTELTSTKLITLLYSTLRAYGDIKTIQENKIATETYYKATVAQLEHSKRHIFNIIDVMPSVLIAINDRLEVTDCNKQAQELTGTQNNQAVGLNLLIVAPFLQPYLNLIKATLNNSHPHCVEKIVINFDRTPRYFDFTIYPLNIGNNHGAVIRLDDITTRMQLDTMMVESEKMVTIGGVITGMVEEIQTPLSLISQNAQNVLNRIDKHLPKNQEVAEQLHFDLEQMDAYMAERKVKHFVETIRDSVNKALSMISEMLRFGRGTESDNTFEKLDDIVNEALEYACKDYEVRKWFDLAKVEIERNFSAGLPTIPCVRTQLIQAFLTLFKNTAHQFSHDHTKVHKLGIKITDDPEFLHVDITDNGAELSEKSLQNIFKPFSEPENLQENALGLSVCHYIFTKAHKGDIQVTSQPGTGNHFHVSLPKANR
jgi:nitrogen-specific signal transduction histidine kinase/CheY-like chemotaxis protein